MGLFMSIPRVIRVWQQQEAVMCSLVSFQACLHKAIRHIMPRFLVFSCTEKLEIWRHKIFVRNHSLRQTSSVSYQMHSIIYGNLVTFFHFKLLVFEDNNTSIDLIIHHPKLCFLLLKQHIQLLCQLSNFLTTVVFLHECVQFGQILKI